MALGQITIFTFVIFRSITGSTQDCPWLELQTNVNCPFCGCVGLLYSMNECAKMVIIGRYCSNDTADDTWCDLPYLLKRWSLTYLSISMRLSQRGTRLMCRLSVELHFLKAQLMFAWRRNRQLVIDAKECCCIWPIHTIVDMCSSLWLSFLVHTHDLRLTFVEH